MPKSGFKSLTVAEKTYYEWEKFHTDRKFNFSALGINSLSALITAILSNVKSKNGEYLTKLVEMEPDRIE